MAIVEKAFLLHEFFRVGQIFKPKASYSLLSGDDDEYKYCN